MLIGRKTIGTIAYMGGIMALPEPFVWAWTQLIQFNAEVLENDNEQLFYTRATVSYHSFARNTLVEQMRGDFLLMFDTDHVFEPDIAFRMLNKMDVHGLDVLVAPYLYKSPPHPPVLYGYDTLKKTKYMIGDWDKTNHPDVMQVYGAGGGCLMVRRSVFDKIRQELKCSPFDIYFDKKFKSPLSEDHSFFERCFLLKIPVFATLEMEAPHLIYKKLTMLKDYTPDEVPMKRIETYLGAPVKKT